MSRVLVLLALLSGCAFGADRWVKLTTPHFDLFTTNSEKRGREVILYFEQIRSFFAQASPLKRSKESPVRIVMFRSEKEYKPYSPNEVAAAYYAPGRYRDYIVLRDGELHSMPAALHEYMHLVINHSGLKIPLWLNEGWADVYASLKPMGKKALIGELDPGRVQALAREKWLPFDALTAVAHDSATYNEKNRAGIFYAESWALVHMLYLSPAYATRFPEFVVALHNGKTTDEACQDAYSKSGAQVYADLKTYLNGKLFGATFDVKLSKSEEEAVASEPTAFDSALLLADLWSVTGKTRESAAVYEKLAAENPGNPEVPQALGYFAWKNNDREGARRQFARAFAAGAKDPEMCFHYAMLELELDRTATNTAVAALRRALVANPDYTDARLQLGNVQLNTRDFAGALASFVQVRKINSERAAQLFHSLAYAHIETGNMDEARKDLETARKWDRTDGDKQRTESLLHYLEARSRPAQAVVTEAKVPERSLTDDPATFLTRSEQPASSLLENAGPSREWNPFVKASDEIQRAEGMAKELDCDRQKLIVEVDGKLVAFGMPEPDRLLLKHDGKNTFDFICGVQKPFHVILEYSASEKSRPDVKGDIRRMEF